MWLMVKFIIIKIIFTLFYYKALLIQNVYKFKFDITILDAHKTCTSEHYFNYNWLTIVSLVFVN